MRKRLLESIWDDFMNHPCEHMRRLAARRIGEMWAEDALRKLDRRLRRISR